MYTSILLVSVLSVIVASGLKDLVSSNSYRNYSMLRQQVLGVLTLILLLGKIKSAKANQGSLLRYNVI